MIRFGDRSAVTRKLEGGHGAEVNCLSRAVPEGSLFSVTDVLATSGQLWGLFAVPSLGIVRKAKQTPWWSLQISRRGSFVGQFRASSLQ